MNLAAWQPASRPLPALLAGMTSAELPQLTVTGVESDSRRLGPGQLFLACAGERHHGLEFVCEAAARGAAALAWDGDQPPRPDPGVPAVRIPGLAARVGDIAARYYGHPSQGLFVVGVTGTDGKTSCVHLLAQALASLGRPCGCLGTLGYGMLPQLAPASHTTPDPIRVQEWLARFAAGSAQDVAMEVSSHALAQDRVRGVCFNVAVLTNIGRDHLDYHADIGAYRAAKRRLFEMPGLEQAILNSDDPVGAHWLRSLPAGVEPIAYGLQARGAGAARYLQASDIQTHVHGL
ncbi:MAG: Mur ligase domain-containing protein, partial [Salinisphaera sp.]|nr:Mur ligase domain-containing protein [Salinisphaera sp.]